jgi:hypothetical protein
MHHHEALILALLLLGHGCRKPEQPQESTPRPVDAIPVQEAEKPPPDLPATTLRDAPAAGPVEAYAKTTRSLRTGTKGRFDLFSLEAEPFEPSWAVQAGDASLVRDGDLLTAWTCTPGERACALGLEFASTARVRIIRIFPGAGSRLGDFEDHSRVSRIRVHTDAGSFEIGLEKGWNHRHVVIPDGLDTRGLVVEIVAAHPGRVDATLYLPELEVFGTHGPRRPPLEIDPRRAIVSFEDVRWTTTWEKNAITGETNPHILASRSWIDLVNGEGSRRRLLHGTAIWGRPQGRFLLVEQVARASCSESYPFAATGTFVLVDRQTRLFHDVGRLGGVMGTVWHDPTAGFATQTRDMAGKLTSGAVLLTDEGWEIVSDTGQSFGDPDGLRTWGFDPATALDRPGPGKRAWGEVTLVQVESDGGDDASLQVLGEDGTLSPLYEDASFGLGLPSVCRTDGGSADP